MKTTPMENSFPPQGSAEWFAQRRGLFTGSEISPLLKPKGIGKGGETYIYKKVSEMLTDPAFDVHFSNMATRHGDEYEPMAFKVHEKRSGSVAEEIGFQVHHAYNFIGASPDRLIHRDGKVGIGECKCPFEPENHIKHCMIDSVEYFRDNFDEYYYQCVCEYICTPNVAFVDFISFDPRMSSKYGYFCFTFTPPQSDCEFLINRAIQAQEMKNQILTKLTTNK